MKKLYLVRHGKSSWNDPMLTDFERPLNDRGRANAYILGEFFKRKDILPDAVFSSPANRALSTARFVASEMDFPLAKIIVAEAIYEARPDDLLELIKSLDNELQSVMLFGHNPSFIMLASQLTGMEIILFPTCTVFGIKLPVYEWKQVEEGEGECILFQSPKMNML